MFISNICYFDNPMCNIFQGDANPPVDTSDDDIHSADNSVSIDVKDVIYIIF